MESKRVPEIRFAEFSGEWEKKYLGDCVNYVKGFAFKSKDFSNSGIRIIRVSDLSTSKIKIDGELYLGEGSANLYTKYKLNKGDIIITTVGSKVYLRASAVGRPIIINDNLEALLNQNLVKIFPDNGFDSYFIYTNLLKERYYNYLSSIERGNANQANIAINDLWKYIVSFPGSYEQTKIGNFFKQLDDTIALQHQELDTLKQTKQGFLQKIFPKEGASVPEVRFPGFSGEWELHKLSEMSEKIGSGKTPKGGTINYISTGIPLLRSQNIYNDRVSLLNVAFISEEINEAMSNSIVKNGDVLLNITGASIGRSAVYNYKEEANVNQHVSIIRPIKKVDSHFIQINLTSHNGQNQIMNNQAGGGREGLNFKQISQMNFYFPSHIEQTQIGNFFKQLDDTIALHQKELDTLKETKEAFLQKMFV